MTITVRPANDSDRAPWDMFVANHPDGSFFHRYGWKHVIEKGARLHAPFLLAEDAEGLVGVLPLSIRNSALFGKALISSMFAVYGGPLALHNDVYGALNEAAWAYARDKGLDILEYRSRKPRNAGKASWHLVDDVSATFIKSIAPDEDARLLDIPRKQRAVVRKALASGLKLKIDDGISVFYDHYARNVRRLGTPVFPKSLFSVMLDVFGRDVEILVASDAGGTPLASLLVFYSGSTILPYYVGSYNHEARRLFAHDFLYWHAMKRGAARGCHIFDFGRSKIGSGPYKFKKNWGFEPQNLGYEYRLANNATVPDLKADSGRYGLASTVWRRLPLPVTKLVGPMIARHLG